MLGIKETILCSILFNVYDKNEFVVNSYIVKDPNSPHYNETFKGKGRSLNTCQNLGVELTGYWQTTSKEKIFVILEEEVKMLENKGAFIAYLVSRYKGVGPKIAQKIEAEYGANYDVLKDYNLLIKIVSHKIANNIVNQTKEFDKAQEVYQLFTEAEVFSNKKRCEIAEKINIDDIYQNPFILSEKEYGHLTFPKINKLCILKQDDERIKDAFRRAERIESGALYNLTDMLFQRGHTWISSTTLVDETIRALNSGIKYDALKVTEKDVKDALNRLNKAHKIKCEKFYDTIRIYNAFFYDCENLIAQESVRRAFSQEDIIDNSKIDRVISDFERINNIKLADCQKLAVRRIVNSKICVVTGSAGTGKTTVLNSAIKCIQSLRGGEIVLAAPTGRAARRMAESTGLEANTLHHLLGISAETDSVIPVATKNIDADYVFVDEASMCDICIIYKLFEQSNKDTRFVFIGDPNQLPSVGAGNVLDDFIQSKFIPMVKLNYIYRQTQDSTIVVNANRVLNGCAEMKSGPDFEIHHDTSATVTQDLIVDKYIQEIARTGDLFEAQIITPKRKDGELSAYQINRKAQEKLNPKIVGKFDLIANGYSFREGDKVICCKNTSTVKNGDIGYVLKVARVGDTYTMDVEFDNNVETFDTEQVKELGFALAHAITVHKSQGSEFKSVLMPINFENRVMLKRNLFYTAITRAKEKMIIVGDKSEIKNAVANNKVYVRNTLLKPRIRKYGFEKIQ